MKEYKKTFIINVDTDEESLDTNFIDTHCDNWKDEESPTEEELTNSLKNECVSWLNDLGFGIEFVEQNQKNSLVLTDKEVENLLDALREWFEVVEPKELNQEEIGLDSERYTNLISKLKEIEGK